MRLSLNSGCGNLDIFNFTHCENMAEINKKRKKNEPRRLGEYLTCSPGSIVMAIKKKLAALERGDHKKGLGEFLVELGIITNDELKNALRRQRADRIGLCPVFDSLTNTELHAIGNHFTEVSFASDEQFITEGENDPTLYILIEGQLEVFIKDKNGKDKHIAYINPIETIGEMGYFQGGIRTASVKTTRQCELLRAPYLNLTHYFEHVPRVANAFLEVIQQRQANVK
ncbi:MAG: hypothetical protein CMF40_03640 [Legionellales bacterium]|nr:hypothetical protein [Legionellales bacterium]|tara:strand:- start:747 stop:1427 length:681 start_codon:yes stop_codon:yes gene_type:complete